MKQSKTLLKSLIALLLIAGMFQACAGDKTSDQSEEANSTESESTETPADKLINKGVGPITSLTLNAEIDQTMADAGKVIYDAKCLACHHPTIKVIGPAPLGILDRRSPEWIMNMILNPEVMILEDPDARALLIEYNMAPMANQNLTEEEARNVLEYFRTIKE